MTTDKYNPESDTFHTTVDWSQSDPLLSTVLETVSIATNRDPQNLPPIHDVMDMESVENVLATTRTQPQVVDGFIQFQYANCKIEITHDAEVTVQPMNSGISLYQ